MIISSRVLRTLYKPRTVLVDVNDSRTDVLRIFEIEPRPGQSIDRQVKMKSRRCLMVEG
jgi:hypothetical protein